MVSAFFACWGIAYGVEILYFLSLAVVLEIVELSRRWLLWQRKQASWAVSWGWQWGWSLAGALIVINTVLNYLWYGTALFSQTHRMPLTEQAGLVGVSVWMSTPLIPTVWYVLFGSGYLPDSVFRNFQEFDPTIAKYSSLPFIKAAYFLGIFTWLPYAWFGLGVFLRMHRKYLPLLVYCSLMFCLNVIATTKKLGFWGGNQYDVRYFYPLILFPGIFIVLGLQTVYTRFSGLRHRVFFLSLFLLLMFSSFRIGWVGVLNNFQPAVHGENKVTVNVMTARGILHRYTLSTPLTATFMNKRNAWIGAVVAYILFAYFHWLFSAEKVTDYRTRHHL